MLEVDVRVEQRGLDVAFVLPAGRVAVLGPNGAGKSSLLGVLAGTVRPDAGVVRLGGTPLVQIEAGRATWVPAHRRQVGLLAQEPLLFPRLSVLDNVTFGPRCHGQGRRAARRTAQAHLEAVGAAHLAARRPHALSGGQAQRVALARVLATDPALLLLDEPLQGIDVATRPGLQALLVEAAARRPTVLVTHDDDEARLLADHVVRLDHGRVVAVGTVAEVLGPPAALVGAACPAAEERS